jgi:hypothetical protein
MQIKDSAEMLKQIEAYLQEPLTTLHQDDVNADAEYIRVLAKYQKLLDTL